MNAINDDKVTTDNICTIILEQLLNVVKFRNYNNHYYIFIKDKWEYLKNSFKVNLYLCEVHTNINFSALDITSKVIEHIKIYPHDVSRFNKLYKKIVDYIKINVLDTAKDDLVNKYNIPLEIYDIIYNLVPDDTNIEIIRKVIKDVLLPKEIIIKKLINKFPLLEEIPTAIEICIKYIELYALVDIIFKLRSSLCEEFHEKKSYPVKKKDIYCYIPIYKEDDAIIKNYIYLQKSSSKCGLLERFINKSMEDKFSREMDLMYFALPQYQRKRNKFPDPKFIYQLFNVLPPIEREDINDSDSCVLYIHDWKRKIPKLLSDTTNNLTKHDKYMLRQFPVWIQYLLAYLGRDICKIPQQLRTDFDFENLTNRITHVLLS
jgi:hypothetical protein